MLDVLISSKLCTVCSKEYPSTLKDFPPDKRHKDGLASHCRLCQRAYIKNNRLTVRGHLLHVFCQILQRCTNTNHLQFKYYGGRGIQCNFINFNEFYNYIINELCIVPFGLTIDRINNDGHYEKGNIRFVSQMVNNRNRRIRSCRRLLK